MHVISAALATAALVARPSAVGSRPTLTGFSMRTPVCTMYSIENPIEVGQRLPDVEVELVDVSGNEGAGAVASTRSIGEVLGSGKSVLLGMPGAYTPTCNDVHLPGFYRSAADLNGLGIDRIALITTNDRFVNAQWQRSMDQCQGVPEGQGPVTMLSDARGDLAES